MMCASGIKDRGKDAWLGYRGGPLYNSNYVMSVLGGSDAKIEDVPFIVTPLKNVNGQDGVSGLKCVGSIITPRFVLSAAHCYGYDFIVSVEHVAFN